MKNTQVVKVCAICGSEFLVKAYRQETAKYCSKACWARRNPAAPRQCPQCDKTFTPEDKSAIYCSRSCARKHKTGKDATAWKGGTSLRRKRASAKGDLAKWRTLVYQRDGYTCQHCGARGNLQAHHIQPVAQYPDLMLDIDNGITLCVPCHEKEHGRKFGTPGKYSKHCADCGAQTSGRSAYCRPCSITRHHASIGHRPTVHCEQCGASFKARNGQRFCSVSCGVKARHAASKRTGSTPVI